VDSFTPRPLSSCGNSTVTREKGKWEGPQAIAEVLEKAKVLDILGMEL
jgi:hypothetical protein